MLSKNAKLLFSTHPGIFFPAPPPLRIGLTSFFYMIPAIASLLNNHYEIYLWTIVTTASFFSDYIMIQKYSYWHIADRIISKSTIAYKISLALYQQLFVSTFLTVFLILAPSIVYLFKAQRAKTRDEWNKNWLKWHTYSSTAATAIIILEKLIKENQPNLS
tara:strand:+ start:828 stop:1310 length:483 start_codon:yes stop_codon:yes gene_type:complete